MVGVVVWLCLETLIVDVEIKKLLSLSAFGAASIVFSITPLMIIRPPAGRRSAATLTRLSRAPLLPPTKMRSGAGRFSSISGALPNTGITLKQ